ncbi:MAG: MoaD/ThiS family protein [Balneolaceae bacterium]
MAIINIPTPLRKFTNQNRVFETDRDDLPGALDHLVQEYPAIKKNLFDENGNVRSYIKIYIGDEEVKPQKNGSVKLEKNTEISIIPAIAGG